MLWLLCTLALAQQAPLDASERAELELVLAPVAGLSADARVAHLEAAVGQSDSAEVNAAVARALAEAYDPDADIDDIRAAALPKTSATTQQASMTLLREYRARHLHIKEETEIRGGGSTVSPGLGGTGGVVMTDPVYSVRTWGIYRGAQRLTVPEYLEATGQTELAEALRSDIARSRRISRGLYVVGGAGAASTLVGVVGAQTTTDADQRALYEVASVGGIAMALGGLLAGSVPAARANKLEQDPSFRFTVDQVQVHLDRANEALRLELGLAPEQVITIEAGL